MEVVWVLMFGGLGFVFADQWANVSARAGEVSVYLLVMLAMLLGSAGWLRRNRLKPAVAVAQDKSLAPFA
jgi:membrane protein DedA with SNARE-associated domain